LLGKNMLHADLTWAGAAGGIISTPRDLQKWVRGVFQGNLLTPKQLKDLTELVSMETGKPVAGATAKDPRAFGLGIGQIFIPGVGRLWFYEGITLGYRTVFTYYPQNDVVITLSLNSQPATDHVGELLTELQNILLK
jgi:D-alanyl-D-alanine carboxypeptidase